jgi:hypothetical protein
MAMPATNITTTAMIMAICIVLDGNKFMTCLQFLSDIFIQMQ